MRAPCSFTGPLDYLIKPPRFLLSQLGFLLPSLLIAAPYLRRDVRRRTGQSELASADAFDRRIVTLLAFGPAAMIVLLSIADRTRRGGAVGLSALAVPRPLDRPQRAAARARHAVAHRLSVGRGVRRLRRWRLRSHYGVLPRFQRATPRCCIPASGSAPRCRAAIAP